MANYYNSHVHVFNGDCAPAGFYGRSYKTLFDKLVFFSAINHGLITLLEWINPLNYNDKGNRLARMLQIGSHSSQEGVFRELLETYHDFPEMKFVVLSMDFDYMEAGEPLMNYLTQLQELTVLKYRYPDKILPFVCVDPRRYQGMQMADFVKTHIEQRGFAGIKMYPALGFYPTDPALDDLYHYAEDNQIPIITHCDRGGIYFQGKPSLALRQPTRLPDQKGNRGRKLSEPLPDKPMEKLLDYFSSPFAFGPVLDKFPKLKLCFAHFGGVEEIKKEAANGSKSWFSEIKRLMRDPDKNVYADISYTLHDDSVFNVLVDTIANAEYRRKILFGTDYFLVAKEAEEGKLFTSFLSRLDQSPKNEAAGVNLFDQIASINPEVFLKTGPITETAIQ